MARANDEITEDLLDKLRRDAGVPVPSPLLPQRLDRRSYISQTLRRRDPDQWHAPADVIYRMMRPGEPPTEDAVGRCSTACSSGAAPTCRSSGMKFNRRESSKLRRGRRFYPVGTEGGAPCRNGHVAVIGMPSLRNGCEIDDDIDHLGNRRVRSVGELAGETSSAPVWCPRRARR